MFHTVALLDLGTPELMLILLIVLLLFGGKKLPELSRSLGSSVKEFKKGVEDVQGTSNKSVSQTASTPEHSIHSQS